MAKERQQRLSSGLWQLQQTGQFCDTVITVSGNVKVQAHAAVLAATSDQLCSTLEVSGNGFHVPIPFRSHTSIPVPRFPHTSFPFSSKFSLPVPIHFLFPFPKLAEYRLLQCQQVDIHKMKYDH